MVTYYVDKDEIYKVAATVNCAVYDASGSTIATCDAGLNVVFKAPTSKIMVSDDNAALTRLSESSGGSGGSGGSGDFAEHMANSTIHVTADEKARWNAVAETGGVSDDDRAYWNAKLDPSAVYEPIVLNPLGTQEDNTNAYGFVYVIPRTGYVTGIDIYCRTSGQAAPYPTTITWVKVWRGNGELLGTSENYVAHVTGAVQKYTFKTPFHVKNGEELRVSFHTFDNLSATEYVMGKKECCMACVALTSGESGGLLGADGNISNSSYTAKHYWHIDAEKFAPFEHSEDDLIHVTPSEKAALTGISSHVSNDSIHMTASDITTIVEDLLIGSTIVITPAGTEEDNYNSYGFACVMPKAGKVEGLTIECRHDGSAIPADTQVWVKVWRGNSELLAVSDNSQVHALDAVLNYTFATPFEVAAGDEIRVSFHTSDGLSTTAYQMGIQCCMRSVRLLDGESGGMLGSQGGFANEGWTAKYAWSLLVPHADDTTIHVSEADRAKWDNAAPKNYGVANAVLITDADGNITASTVITVAELNTLNNNTLNLKTKLADLESRLAALETA